MSRIAENVMEPFVSSNLDISLSKGIFDPVITKSSMRVVVFDGSLIALEVISVIALLSKYAWPIIISSASGAFL